jgi:hypothetical protein
MADAKIYPDDYLLEPEEIERLCDWAAYSLAALEQLNRRPVRVSAGAMKYPSARDALEARKRERGSKFNPSRR